MSIIQTQSQHTPDILDCLASLSNDEVFTPPRVVNDMLDMLPAKVFESTETTFLDPACKSGIFLREIAKRLLKAQIPDYETRTPVIEAVPEETRSREDREYLKNLQARIDHIFKNQLFAIAITDLTANLSRRSVYCSRKSNGKYSITKFENPIGNIRFENIKHTFKNGSCIFCGASKNVFGNEQRQNLEYHAYEFIHSKNPEKIFNMKFDVIIGNPPYHLKSSAIEEQQNAAPIYNLFVESAKKLNSRFICMIIPSRWMTGGRRELDGFRFEMLRDDSIKILHDYKNAGSVFPGVLIKGGVCYFLRDSLYHGKTDYFFHNDEKIEESNRYLNDLNVGLFVRDKNSLSIIQKVTGSKDFNSFEKMAGSQTPFGIVTSFKDYTSKKTQKNTMKIYGYKFVGWTSPKNIIKSKELADVYKVFAPKAVGIGNIESDVIKPFVPEKPSICTQTYIIYGKFTSKLEAENLCSYMGTKFFHFLLGQLKNTQQMSPVLFKFIPILDWKQSWDDKKLYKKYKLTDSEINYIEQTVWSNISKE